jgi:predicted DNA-binding antitoxin AbrB/MazE fold protein
MTVEAIYEQGLLRPLQPLALTEGAKVEVTVRAPDTDKLEVMREALNDPLFLADLQEVAQDFRFVNAENNKRQS